MRVHRHLHSAPDHENALAWIYRIATNYCLNELRDRKLRPQSDADLPEMYTDDLATALANRDAVARLILRSAAKLRVPAWLHYVDGLDHGEVARVLGVSRRTVVSRIAAFTSGARKYVARGRT